MSILEARQVAAGQDAEGDVSPLDLFKANLGGRVSSLFQESHAVNFAGLR
jgi:hypothetical protein